MAEAPVQYVISVLPVYMPGVRRADAVLNSAFAGVLAAPALYGPRSSRKTATCGNAPGFRVRALSSVWDIR